MLLHGMSDLNKYKIKNSFNNFQYIDIGEHTMESKCIVNMKILFELIIHNFVDILQYKLLITHDYILLKSILKFYYLFILSYGSQNNITYS